MGFYRSIKLSTKTLGFAILLDARETK